MQQTYEHNLDLIWSPKIPNLHNNNIYSVEIHHTYKMGS